MSAKQKQGMAALEEFLQQKYVEYYEKFEDDELKINVLEKECPQYFYIPKNEGVGNLNYIVDTDGNALYPIKKSGLPDEIKEGLVGGDAGKGTYLDYYNLNDVYGVTNDLKVYYCSNGKDSIYGLTKDSIDKDNPQREVFKSGSEMLGVLSSYDSDGNGILTAEELRAVSKLTVDSSMTLTSLEDFYNLGGLEELTIRDKQFTSLNGLQACTKLNYIYLKNCEVGDYSALKGISNSLTYLYIHSLDDAGFDRLCTGMQNTDFIKLEYFGIFGRHEDLFLDRFTNNSSFESKSATVAKKLISNLRPLEKLSKVTKEKIKYLLLNHNNITDTEELINTEYLKDFKNTYVLHLGSNSLKSLKGLEEMNSLAYLYVPFNKLGEGLDGEELNETKDCLASLKNNITLYLVRLDNNPDLRQVEYFSNNVKIRYLYLGGCSRNMNVNNIGSIILACGINYSIPCKFLQVAKYNWTDYYYTSSPVSGKELLTASALESDLFENSYITELDLAGCKLKDTKESNAENGEITDTVLNKLLKSMPQLTRVNLNSTNLENLEFCAINSDDGYAYCPRLNQLFIYNTYVTDVSNLNNIIARNKLYPQGKNLRYFRDFKNKR